MRKAAKVHWTQWQSHIWRTQDQFLISPTSLVGGIRAGICLKSVWHTRKSHSGTCYYKPGRIRQIHWCGGNDETTRLVLVIPWLDYCNSMLSGLPSCTVDMLQRVQSSECISSSTIPTQAMWTYLMVSVGHTLTLQTLHADIVMRRYLAVSACRSYLCACVPWLCKRPLVPSVCL